MIERDNTYGDTKFIGTTQSTRLINKTNPLDIAIDDRKKEELIAILQEYSRLLRFHDKEGNSDADWQPFFNANISAVISSFISKDLSTAQFNFNESIKNFNSTTDLAKKFDHLKIMINIIYFQLSDFEELRNKLLKIQYKNGDLEKYSYYDVEAYYEQAVTGYIQEFVTILRSAVPFTEKLKIEFEAAHKILESNKNIKIDSSEIPSELDSIYIRLRILYNKLTETTISVKENLMPFLRRSLEEKNDHQPHIGLLYGFLDQYKKLQNSINKIPEKFLHIYYVDFLKQERQKHVAPYAYVNFEISPYVDNKLIEEKTVLLASLDKDGIPHRFETLYPVNVGHCCISDVKSLYFDKGYRETITNKYALITESFMAPVANSQDGMGAPFNPDKLASWPTFGEDQMDKEPNLRNMIDANLGFSISSPVLFLNEGKRNVSVRLNFTEKSTRDLVKLFKDISSKEKVKSSMMDIFFKIFSSKGKKRNITIYLSSIKGWHKVDPQTIKIFQDHEEEWNPGHLCFSFSLDPTAPAIIPYDERLHYGKFVSTVQPTMVILLNNDREPYLYSFLQKLILQDVVIDAKVENIRNLSIYNEFGLIDSAQPFFPFGPTPGKNSYFLLGSQEIFKKNIAELDIEIEWFDLPKTPGLFNQKYEDYNIKYDDFNVRIGNLSDGEFKLEPFIRPLFQTIDRIGSDKLKDEYLYTHYHLNHEDLKNLGYKTNDYLEYQNEFNSKTNSGYLKIILETPEDGFGQKRYQEILSKHMLKNARLINKALVTDENENEPDIYFPSMPEVPLISNIFVKYTAKDTIDLTQENETFQEVNHIHPFGYEKIYPNLKYQDQLPFLLPQYEEDGYLILGLEKCKKTEIVSLLFQMTPVYYQDKDQYTLPVIKWQYLTYNNVWRQLPGEYILRDETDTFTRTGVIQIKIPADISHLSHVMEGGKFWIRICATGDIQLLNHTIAIFPNATLTKWIDQSDPSVLNEAFPPHSIISLDNKIQGVTKVNQPFESFGGKAEETFIEFYTRVSERIRHKNRGWTAWDVERIILNKYDDIEQVKCISGLGETGERVYEYLDLEEEKKSYEINYRSEMDEFNSNKVIIVIVPRKLKYLKEHITIANFRKLEQIKKYLGDKMSPFVSIKVRNPEFEYLRIQCDIKFADRGNEGYDIAKLKKEIANFICPWFIDQSNALEFNKEIHVDALKDFLKSLDFVTFITRFSIIQIIEDGYQYHMIDSADSHDFMHILKPTKPWATFIPDQDHIISIIEDEYEEEPVKVQAPVRFKNEYNILKKTKIIQLKRSDAPRTDNKKVDNKPFNPFTLEL